MPFFIIAGAVNAAIAVMLGAFGAHALKREAIRTLLSHLGNCRSISNVSCTRSDSHRDFDEFITNRSDYSTDLGGLVITCRNHYFLG